MRHCKDVWGIGVMNGIKDVGLLNSSRIGRKRGDERGRERKRGERSSIFL